MFYVCQVIDISLKLGIEIKLIVIEDILNLRTDILLHEFGHGVNLVSAEPAIRGFKARMQNAYNSA